MSATTSKWLTGCGIGCAVIVALVVLIIVVGYMFIKSAVNEFKEIEVSSELLEKKFGTERGFCPAPDGKIEPDRIQVFLAVRDSLARVQVELESSIVTIGKELAKGDGNKKSPFNKVLRIMGNGLKVIPQMVDFYKARNYVLLDKEMSIGEYYYIYILAYYNFLDKSPEDGPDFQLTGDNKDENIRWHYEQSDDKEQKENYPIHVKRDRRIRIVMKTHRLFLSMLNCQLEELKKDNKIKNNRIWQRKIENEIQLLSSDPDRIPWQDVLPISITNSLEPFREQLNNSYNEMMNAIELNPYKE